MSMRRWSGLLLTLCVCLWAAGAPGVAQATLADPPPEGFVSLYEFSGAQNDNDVTGDDIATVVHCTNRGEDDLSVIVEFFGTDAATTFSSGVVPIPSGQTRTLTTQRIPVFFGTDLDFGFFSSASGRISASGSDLICSVQLADPTSDSPNHLGALELFRPR